MDDADEKKQKQKHVVKRFSMPSVCVNLSGKWIQKKREKETWNKRNSKRCIVNLLYCQLRVRILHIHIPTQTEKSHIVPRNASDSTLSMSLHIFFVENYKHFWKILVFSWYFKYLLISSFNKNHCGTIKRLEYWILTSCNRYDEWFITRLIWCYQLGGCERKCTL